jgi:hypothetical protein
MDQTNIEFKPKFRTLINNKGSRTVASKDTRSNQRRATLHLTVAADGIALPPFLFSK